MDENRLSGDEGEFEEEPEDEYLSEESKIAASSPIGLKINFKPSDRRVRDLHADWRVDNLLDPSPFFQRKYVWNLTKASKFIESILLNVPIPYIYTSDEGGSELVIDGQQRLISLFKFLENEFCLRGLKFYSNLNRKYYKDLSPEYQTKIRQFTLPIITILQPPESDDNVKFEIFERINSGAVNVSKQELWNSIYRGPYNDFLKECALEPLLLELACTENDVKRMKDVEMVMRFFAFDSAGFRKTEARTLTGYLEKHMTHERSRFAKISPAEREAEFTFLRKQFRKSLELSQHVFGKHAFRTCRLEEGGAELQWNTPINKSLYTVIMWGFSRYEKPVIVAHADAIREGLIDILLSDDRFNPPYGRTRESTVQYKFMRWGSELDAITQSPKQPRCFSYALKEELLSKSSTCPICGQQMWSLDATEVDHIEPYWRGGLTIPENAQLVHRFCNRSKSGR